ncbi:low-density lipoprotein receptor-related protein 8-like [Ptychodera flava]|uniref:low-density lipoprotein receptor-related protein 8-like n=1 Tax=Ptychodera flava TaxID=63121 RepID=UPI00396A8D71
MARIGSGVLWLFAVIFLLYQINIVTATCPADDFVCDDGTCIAASWECDYFEDCVGAEDEADCDCSPDDYYCDDGTCIPLSWLCDTWDDCDSAEDEAGCDGGDGGGDEDGDGANSIKAAGFGLSFLVAMVTVIFV